MITGMKRNAEGIKGSTKEIEGITQGLQRELKVLLNESKGAQRDYTGI